MALECPTPQAGGQGVIQESPANIAELRRRNPGARPAAIVNDLVTAYCPVVAAQADLDDVGKRARLDAFASEVVTIAMQP